MKDLIKNKYFYIGTIISALAILGISTITYNILDTVEPSIDNFVNKEYIVKSLKYTDEIELVCSMMPNQEFLLVSFIGQNLEIISKIKKYSDWPANYSKDIEVIIKGAIQRGGHKFILYPIGSKEKGTAV